MRAAPAMPTNLWNYQARPVRVIDGDTLSVLLDKGMRETREETVRLLGINTPERKGATRPAGDAAMQFAQVWLTQASGSWPLIIHTEREDAFGRWLSWVWRASDGRCLNSDLLAAGHAVPFMG